MLIIKALLLVLILKRIHRTEYAVIFMINFPIFQSMRLVVLFESSFDKDQAAIIPGINMRCHKLINNNKVE